MSLLLNLAYLVISFACTEAGILYPRVSETREQISLDGLWNFALTDPTNTTKGHDDAWYLRDLRAVDSLDVDLMPVPSSYNDIGTDGFGLRDHVGPVWYQRSFIVPKSWNGRRVWIRFSSACYAADVWINGEAAVSHSIGHLPFQAEVSSLVNYGTRSTITVSVDNTLTNTTIPEGSIQELNSGRLKQQLTFDFFNYAGIDRPVVLYTTPSTYIDDITVVTDVDGTNGFVNYTVTVEGSDEVTARIGLVDKDGNEVATDTVLEGSLFVPDANLWWPYLMDPNPGYLYSLEVQLLDTSGTLLDKYEQPVGIRTIFWDSDSVKINNRSIYLRGFGRHEDSDIRGKGLDLPLIIRDHNLIKWIGANAYRTSHYPYAEEIMDLADQLGIMIINECPAVGLIHLGLGGELLDNHKQSLTEMYNRDKNRPSVIMWSAGNEPASSDKQATDDHFREVFEHIHSLDNTRPVTVINFNGLHDNQGGEYIDIIGFNFYTGWYQDTGELDVVVNNLLAEGQRLRTQFNKPVMITEYGSDTQEGLHILPSFVWAEEYQTEIISHFFQAFDQMRNEGYFIGEMIWCFADFKTDQSVNRVGGNKKGIFTRNREPKASAHLLRKRYWALAELLDDVEPPADVNEYIIGN
ncbi:beta-glucuronidase-like [Tenebrio molitor]|uniref:beta-glucuronidase-like n=1 Tax=Tenebrio molitor TaxID=7067 RepID=UPI0036248DC3